MLTSACLGKSILLQHDFSLITFLDAFLNAYGYTVRRAAAGRPKGNSEEVIEELKKRYPDGMPFNKTSEIIEANPDLIACLE